MTRFASPRLGPVVGAGPDASPFTAFGARLILYNADLQPTLTSDYEIGFNSYILDAGANYGHSYVTFSGGVYGITIPDKPGLYMLTACADMYSRSTDTQVRPWLIKVIKNGSEVIAFNQRVERANAQYDIQPQIAVPVYLEAGDVLTVKVNGPADVDPGGTAAGYGVIGFGAVGPVGTTFLSVAWMGSVDPFDVFAP